MIKTLLLAPTIILFVSVGLHYFLQHARNKMTLKATPNTDILIFDTLQSVAAEPLTVNATTAGGLTVIVPAGTVPGEFVQLNADGTAPTAVITPIDQATFAASYTQVA